MSWPACRARGPVCPHPVMRVDEAAHGLEVGGVFEIGDNDPPPSQLSAPTVAPGPLDPRHVGTEVGEQHRGVRPGAHTREFDDLDAVQRAR
jgi:hypothetical protein